MGVFDEEEPSFFRKYRVLIVVGILAVIGVLLWSGRKTFNNASAARQEQNMIMATLPPPPPPPPPPSQTPPPPPENEQRMVTQEPMNAMETKPDETSKAPPADEPPIIGTSIQGDGPADGFGVGRGSSYFGGPTSKTITRAESSRWGWYANQVQSTLSQVLQSNKKTRTADFRVDVRIWADQTGRITRARMKGSTGNASLDDAITNEVLVGLILQESPPDGMPMPIVLRLTARHSQAALSKQYQ